MVVLPGASISILRLQDYFNGLKRYSRPFSFTSYTILNIRPNTPSGKPFWENHTTYRSGRSRRSRPLYFPKGMRVLATFNSTSESNMESSMCFLWRPYKPSSATRRSDLRFIRKSLFRFGNRFRDIRAQDPGACLSDNDMIFDPDHGLPNDPK